MIIKSMSRSSLSFKQLINYLDKEDVLDRFSWNMYSDKNFNKELVKEFMENANLLKNSRGRVYLYHEVLSLEINSLDLKKSKDILYDLANQYLNMRAKNQMVFGAIHNDTNNLHIHLLISSNEVGSSKRIRLSKKEFSLIQAKLEAYKNTNFIKLEKTSLYQTKKDKSKSKRAEQEIKHKRKKLSTKDQILEDLKLIFSKTTTKTYFENVLKSLGYEIYTRGSLSGVIFESKKYRFKTLGLESDYKKTITRVENSEKRREKRHEFKNSKSKTYENSFSR